MADKTSFFVSAGTKGNIRASFWEGEGLHVSITLVPAEAARLAASITKALDSLPRIASEADLGLVA